MSGKRPKFDCERDPWHLFFELLSVSDQGVLGVMSAQAEEPARLRGVPRQGDDVSRGEVVETGAEATDAATEVGASGAPQMNGTSRGGGVEGLGGAEGSSSWRDRDHYCNRCTKRKQGLRSSRWFGGATEDADLH